MTAKNPAGKNPAGKKSEYRRHPADDLVLPAEAIQIRTEAEEAERRVVERDLVSGAADYALRRQIGAQGFVDLIQTLGLDLHLDNRLPDGIVFAQPARRATNRFAPQDGS